MNKLLLADAGCDGDVDGHGFGSGEADIFILAPEPTAIIQTAKSTLTEMELLDAARIASRDVAGEHYSVVCPQNGDVSFSVG